jgi:4-methyl-5(b-hydroxyethyl)-thiazole monophosphate biosynthesis
VNNLQEVPKIPRALILLHPGFEEIEAVTPVDLLRRAGVEVVMAALGPKTDSEQELWVEGGRAVVFRADARLEELGPTPQRDFDLLILPGGPGVDALRADPGRSAVVGALARGFHAEGKWVAAICAAPLLLLDAGLLEGKRVTSFPGAADELRARARAYAEERVVLDGSLVTSRGAGSSEEFSLALVALLAGAAKAEDIRRRIVARA